MNTYNLPLPHVYPYRTIVPMNMCVQSRKQSGFTLVELLIAVSVVAVLATIVYASFGEARKKAHDTQRVTDIQTLQLALKLYHEKYATYLVSGTGQGNVATANGAGSSVVTALYNEGLLPSTTLDDPTQTGADGYLLYLCSSNQVYALYATKERPITSESNYIGTITCSGSTASGLGKNYGVTNQ